MVFFVGASNYLLTGMALQVAGFLNHPAGSYDYKEKPPGDSVPTRIKITQP